MSQTYGASAVGVREQLLDGLVDRGGAAVVDLGEDLALELECPFDLLGQDLLVEEVLDPDADPVHLVGVRRADAAAGGADLAAAEEPLGDLVEGAVVVGDDVRVGADLEPAGVGAALLEPVDLVEEHLEVDDDAVADDRRAARREDAARQQVERIFLVADHHRVAGVVAAVELDDVVHSAAQVVGRLALALVAPLGADDHDRWHLLAPSEKATSPVARPGSCEATLPNRFAGRGSRAATVTRPADDVRSRQPRRARDRRGSSSSCSGTTAYTSPPASRSTGSSPCRRIQPRVGRGGRRATVTRTPVRWADALDRATAGDHQQ